MAFRIYELESQAKQYIPTKIELQTRLKAKGYYDGEIDGKIGKETLEQWERYICDRYAQESFKEMKKEIDYVRDNWKTILLLWLW